MSLVPASNLPAPSDPTAALDKLMDKGFPLSLSAFVAVWNVKSRKGTHLENSTVGIPFAKTSTSDTNDVVGVKSKCLQVSTVKLLPNMELAIDPAVEEATAATLFLLTLLVFSRGAKSLVESLEPGLPNMARLRELSV